MKNEERKEFLRRFWIAMEIIMEEKRLSHSQVVGNNTSLAKSRELNPTIVRIKSFADNLDMDFERFITKLNDEMEQINKDSKSLLPIGTILKYKTLEVENIGYSDIHDGKDYIIQPIGEPTSYQGIVRYDDENLEEIK